MKYACDETIDWGFDMWIWWCERVKWWAKPISLPGVLFFTVVFFIVALLGWFCTKAAKPKKKI